jgi:hypothetical protein
MRSLGSGSWTSRPSSTVRRRGSSGRAVSRFAGITLEISQDDLVTSTTELVHLNREVTASHPVCRVGHWVTRGTEQWVPLDQRDRGPTLCILVEPVDRTLTPEDYLTGVPLTIVSTRRTPSSALDPRAKTTSRMNAIVAEMEGSANGGAGAHDGHP